MLRLNTRENVEIRNIECDHGKSTGGGRLIKGDTGRDRDSKADQRRSTVETDTFRIILGKALIEGKHQD
jgi:hypothetical protein